MTIKLWRIKPVPAFDPSRLFRPSRHVLSTTEGEETVLLDMKRGRYYTLNEIGSRAWALLASGATGDGIVHSLCTEYDTHSCGDDAVEGDVSRLLERLCEMGLVVADDSSTESAR
jgi:hypothetical protein